MRQLPFGLVCTILFAFHAQASILVYTDTMAGANETPPNASTASGQATITVDTVTNMLSVFETWTGLISPASAAHIHCCVPAGANTGVALPFTTFPNTTSGTFSFTYDLTQSSTYVSTFVTASGGTAALAESALLAGLADGLAYTNIHDSVYPGGEIRGQLASAPEPGTMALASAALLGLIAIVRRRR